MMLCEGRRSVRNTIRGLFARRPPRTKRRRNSSAAHSRRGTAALDTEMLQSVSLGKNPFFFTTCTGCQSTQQDLIRPDDGWL